MEKIKIKKNIEMNEYVRCIKYNSYSDDQLTVGKLYKADYTQCLFHSYNTYRVDTCTLIDDKGTIVHFDMNSPFSTLFKPTKCRKEKLKRILCSK